jgi:hypothetical protein
MASMSIFTMLGISADGVESGNLSPAMKVGCSAT